MPTISTEAEARQSPQCPGCGKAKEIGCVVCWRCYKQRTDCIPLKHWTAGRDGSPAKTADEALAAWLLMLNGRASHER